ncbi:hypothetical protein H4R18_003391 [Coemansia javaensis]|uniref:Uncharacterized protein n=1 Tax=Coemansia javaensis TaxID=2761396 RepID=A0A9W8HAI2_9FUNG|nr:hypothetical protein H4R18_003391 [Coemansia javaensis]
MAPPAARLLALLALCLLCAGQMLHERQDDGGGARTSGLRTRSKVVLGVSAGAGVLVNLAVLGCLWKRKPPQPAAEGGE